MKHSNDEAQLNQWYNDLTARLAKTHQSSHSTYVANVMATIFAIGEILDRKLPVIDWHSLMNKRKR